MHSRRKVHPAGALAAGLALAACSGGDGGGADAGGDIDAGDDIDAAPEVDAGPATTSLISHDAWAEVAEADDPLSEHRPAPVECPEDATGVESLDGQPAYLVNTSVCNYQAAAQPSLEPVPAGATLHATLFHFALSTPDGEPAEAHVAVQLDGAVAWEETVSIPADSDFLEVSWEAAAEYPADTEIGYHLHNHGDNEWYLLDVAVEDP